MHQKWRLLIHLSALISSIDRIEKAVYVYSAGYGYVSMMCSEYESSLPPITTVFNGGNDDSDSDYEVIMRALEIRREVTLEIFKEAMRKGKFGITYSTNLASRLYPQFIDYVMIQATAMKQLPEFANLSFNVRAKACLEDCNVVPLIRWLKHNGLSYPQIGKLICNSRGNIEAIRSTADWLKSIHVNGRFIGVALLRGGENVLERNAEELDEMAWCLEKNGVKREWMGYVVSRCPELLTFSMEELETRMNFYFDMGMNEKDFGTMVFDFPKVLGFYSLEEMKQKVSKVCVFFCRSCVCFIFLMNGEMTGLGHILKGVGSKLYYYGSFLHIDSEGFMQLYALWMTFDSLTCCFLETLSFTVIINFSLCTQCYSEGKVPS